MGLGRGREKEKKGGREEIGRANTMAFYHRDLPLKGHEHSVPAPPYQRMNV
jgi:hypothetical protein